MPESVNTLVYGKPGAGKTVFLGTAQADPRTMPALLLNLEGGTRSIKSKVHEVTPEELLKALRAKDDSLFTDHGLITMVILDGKTGWTKFADIVEYLYNVRNPFKCLMIDSLSELHKVCMAEHLAKVLPSKKAFEPSQARIQDWGKVRDTVNTVIRAMRDMDCHTFITALSESEKDELTGAVYTQPLLSGKLQVEVPAILDFVVYITYDAKKGVRQYKFADDGKALAKDRTEGGRLGPQALDNLTVVQYLDIILAEG